MKQVRETQAGKAVSCYVVLKDGKICATIHSHYSKSGLCTVDVWEKSLVHQGRAGGYGYDKFTAALSGAVICGVKLYDHCVGVSVGQFDHFNQRHPELAEILSPYLNGRITEQEAKEMAAKLGAEFANRQDRKYQSLYYASGLERLRLLGFQVEQVL